MAVQAAPEAQGNVSCSRLWTPPNAQEIREPEHCVPLSLEAIEAVVSRMTAMLYGVFEPPAMAAVETEVRLKLARPNMPPNHVLALAFCITRTALKFPLVEPVEAMHGVPPVVAFAKVLRHKKVAVVVTLVSNPVAFLSPEPEP